MMRDQEFMDALRANGFPHADTHRAMGIVVYQRQWRDVHRVDLRGRMAIRNITREVPVDSTAKPLP